jgi:hypothetical protein
VPLENDLLYACPSCGEENAIGIDQTAGRRQHLVEDCPVCCRPLVFDVVIDHEGDAILERVERE